MSEPLIKQLQNNIDLIAELLAKLSLTMREVAKAATAVLAISIYDAPSDPTKVVVEMVDGKTTMSFLVPKADLEKQETLDAIERKVRSREQR